jgi:hypothetical protein
VEEPLPTRTQILARVRAGASYEDVGAELRIPPGQAYMIATGLPADGSDVPSRSELLHSAGVVEGSTQHLVGPDPELPSHKDAVSEWMKSRAAADAPLRRAGEERTAEPPPVQGEDETDDVVAVIGWDHSQVQFLLEQLETIPGVRKGGSRAKQEQRVSIVDMIRIRLSQHETAEEEHFWPAVRESLPDGDRLGDEALAQEQEGKDLLQALEGLPGDDDRFDALVEDLAGALRKHVAFEDTVLLEVKASVPPEVRSEVGRRFMAAKEHAPTRPHPHAPDRGAPLRVAAKLAGPLDQARDALGGRPAERKGQAEQKPANEVTTSVERTSTEAQQ